VIIFSDFMQVQYLDCLDFGAHIVGSGVPRSVSWRGDMIVEYSELDRISNRCFGRRRLRTDLPSCYLNVYFLSFVGHQFLLFITFSDFFCNSNIKFRILLIIF
jgi:hypothetical protein